MTENEQQNEQQNKHIGIVYAIIAVLIVVVVVLVISTSGGGGGDDTPRAPNEILAWVACKSAVEASLKSPSTAGFPVYKEAFVQELEDGTWRVAAWVDAENSFGATVRAHFVCVLEYDDGDWRLKDITIE